MKPTLAEPAFPGDDGSADRRMADAADDTERLAVFAQTRVFVPVVAVAGDAPARGDKEADMAAVLTTGADGRHGLLAFSSAASMATWDAAARPVPVRGANAAQAALDDGAHAIVIDIAGPVPWIIETEDLSHIAAFDTLVRAAHGTAWVSSDGAEERRAD